MSKIPNYQDLPNYQNPNDFSHPLDAIRAADIVEATKLFRHCLETAYLQGQKDLAEDIAAAVNCRKHPPNDTNL